MLMLCPICAEEYLAHQSDCPGCGIGLIPMSIEQPPVPDSKQSGRGPAEFVELCRPRLHPVAMLIKQMLEQHGVSVWIQGAHSISVMPYLAFGGQLRVLVASDQLGYARELYEAYFEGDEETDYTEEAITYLKPEPPLQKHDDMSLTWASAPRVKPGAPESPYCPSTRKTRPKRPPSAPRSTRARSWSRPA